MDGYIILISTNGEVIGYPAGDVAGDVEQYGPSRIARKNPNNSLGLECYDVLTDSSI